MYICIIVCIYDESSFIEDLLLPDPGLDTFHLLGTHTESYFHFTDEIKPFAYGHIGSEW